MIFGGEGLNYKESSSRFLNDIWTLRLDLNDIYHIGFTWKQQVGPASSHSGSRRWGYGATSNTHGGMVVFGGMESLASTYLRDMWYWLPSSASETSMQGHWLDMSTAPPLLSDNKSPTMPCQRIGMLLVALPRTGIIIAIGGETVKSSPRKTTDVNCLSDA